MLTRQLMTPSRERRLYDAILRSEPQIYYPMCEHNGIIANNKANISRYFSRGDLSPSPLVDQPGKVGKAYTFDGVNDVLVSTTSNPSSTDLTISGIMNWAGAPNGANATQHIASKRDLFSTTMMWGLALDKTNAYKFLVYGDGGAFPFWNYTPPVGTPIYWAWRHRNGGGDDLIINGVFHSTVSVITFGAGTASNLRIGSVDTISAEFFNGKLQHVAVHPFAVGDGTLRNFARIGGFV